MSTPNPRTDRAANSLAERYQRVRSRTLALCEPLSPEDMTVQSMPDASPAKWHLAHVTWFFERFVLQPHAAGYAVFDAAYDHLFNSYYFTVGQMHRRPRRGLITRPGVERILAWRAHVDSALPPLLESADAAIRFLATLGLHHEQQHQELILTDIQHLLAQNPQLPPYCAMPESATRQTAAPLSWHGYPGGATEIGAAPAGADGDPFVYDNETPRHRVWLEPFELASRPVSNAEFRQFVGDGGYARSEWWLADGWSRVQDEGWRRPLYWQDDLRHQFTLGGLLPIEGDAPVCHLSYYEADAYARWAAQQVPGARLPTEAEWELAARELPLQGHFAEAGVYRPRAAGGSGLRQMFGDVWEWTASPYAPYPGFQPLAGSLGEYNGKFMCSQMVLRGGSCATPEGHLRPTYRNFFYPHQRWQFSGLRLARTPR
jgi:ergothioneine biosynthesis protein EgtB